MEKVKLNLKKFSTSSGDESSSVTSGNLQLAKPLTTDTYNIAVFNSNMDKIDAAITTLQNNALTFVKTGEF